MEQALDEQLRLGRRGLLAGGAAVGAAVTVGGWASPAGAAAYPNYYVAITEQRTNRVVVMYRDSWTEAGRLRSWSPGAGGWGNLSDVKFRDTTAFGKVAVAAASGGKVGIYDITDEKDQELNDFLWSASPGGNPHSVERIPNYSCVVAASSEKVGGGSGGFLTLYAPSDGNKPSTLAAVQTISFSGAHGVIWDPTRAVLWAIGNGQLRSYSISGVHRGCRLTRSSRTFDFAGLGHDLQPDFTNKNKLLITNTYGAFEVDIPTMTARTLRSEGGLKSFSRHASGEYLWTKADGVSPRTWATKTVRFSSGTRARSGDQIYKARIYTTAFN